MYPLSIGQSYGSLQLNSQCVRRCLWTLRLKAWRPLSVMESTTCSGRLFHTQTAVWRKLLSSVSVFGETPTETMWLFTCTKPCWGGIHVKVENGPPREAGDANLLCHRKLHPFACIEWRWTMRQIFNICAPYPDDTTSLPWTGCVKGASVW